ncbi:MAG: hypothetical protein ACYTEQ_30035, partial [Planctomycetota bacterium]
ESQIAAAQAQVGMTSYLRSFEQSLIIPLYEMRNQINMQMLDAPYVYGIIGQGAIDWRQAEPAQIRANVDFICEGSERETNRIVITQQILQLAKVAPLAERMGIPVRYDKLFEGLCEQGFSWSKDKIQDIFPSLKLEKEGVDIDRMLLQTMLLRLALGGGMMGAGGKLEVMCNEILCRSTACGCCCRGRVGRDVLPGVSQGLRIRDINLRYEHDHSNDHNRLQGCDELRRG